MILYLRDGFIGGVMSKDVLLVFNEIVQYTCACVFGFYIGKIYTIGLNLFLFTKMLYLYY